VGWNGPATFANFNTPAAGFNRLFDSSKFNPWNANDPANRFFDPSAFTDASPQKLGTAPPRFPGLRGLWSRSEDASIMKKFSIRERARLELRLELFNGFNRHFFGAPSTNLNDAFFGNVRLASGSREGQLGARVEW